ncbi:hypothetical protein GCM10023340_14950 [Nocardioides marinquilinus]|uniref:Uncharacterized protein n=1 Tax=Nocardioides marinquilinus TaxID=1210400 RepID=A0ABP9PF06_9ACTN
MGAPFDKLRVRARAFALTVRGLDDGLAQALGLLDHRWSVSGRGLEARPWPASHLDHRQPDSGG